LKNRLRDIETDCRDRLHVWLLRIVGASTAPTSMALPCRWRSRPQHQKRTHAPQQNDVYGAMIYWRTAVVQKFHMVLGGQLTTAFLRRQPARRSWLRGRIESGFAPK